MSSPINGLDISNEDPSQRFDFIAKVGEGSYGSVYKAIDRTDGMVVAVKVLEISPEEVAASADIVKEINILKHCNSKYIVAYRGSYFKDGKLWIAMEYCGAGSISDIMAICDILLSERQIAAVMEQCLHGLHYLHTNKKIHRDIKSGNILLTYNGECKLADFGVSAELTNTLAKRVTLIGTPYFMAPEVLQQSQYDAKADIWSLGITAYELAIGQPPHADIHPMRAIFLISSSPAPKLPTNETEQFSAEFHSFMDACLQKDPNNRKSATELLQHPFIKKSAGIKEITNLLTTYRDDIERFRASEAEEQQESKEHDPSVMANNNNNNNHNDNTVVPNNNNNAGTFAANNGTWVANGDSTMVIKNGGNNEYATMISRNNNEYATMISTNNNDYATMINRNNEYATMVAIDQNAGGDMSTMVIHNKPQVSHNSQNHGEVLPMDVAFVTIKALQVFSAINANSSAADIAKARKDMQALLLQDKAALDSFYTSRLAQLDQAAAKKK